MRDIYSFYFFGGVREIIPIYPLYAIMFIESGISPFELSTLFVIWAAVGIIFEIPSGALADRFSRKWLIIVSSAFKSVAFLCWFLFRSFEGYAAGFILWGIGSTLRSGAWEALLHDLLATRDRALDFGKHYGRIAALGTAGVVLGELAGGVLIAQGYDVVLLVSMIIPLIATIPFFLFVVDPPKHTEAASRGYFATLGAGVSEAIGSRSILYIILTYALLIVTFGVYDEYVGPTFREKGFSLAMVAYLGVGVLTAQSAGHWFASRFEGLGIGRLFAMIAVSAGALLFVPMAPGIVVAVLIAAFFFMFGLSMTLFQVHLQAEIQGASRATVTSVVGMADGIGAILWFFAFGLMAENSSMAEATQGLGMIVIGLCAGFYWLARRWNISRQTQAAS